MSSIILVLLLIKFSDEICAVAGAAEDLENGFILDKNDCFGWGIVDCGTVIEALVVGLCGTVVGGTVIEALVVGLCALVVGGTVIVDGTDTVDSGFFLNILLKNDCFGCVVFCAVGIVICGV